MADIGKAERELSWRSPMYTFLVPAYLRYNAVNYEKSTKGLMLVEKQSSPLHSCRYSAESCGTQLIYLNGCFSALQSAAVQSCIFFLQAVTSKKSLQRLNVRHFCHFYVFFYVPCCKASYIHSGFQVVVPIQLTILKSDS